MFSTTSPSKEEFLEMVKVVDREIKKGSI